MRACRACFERVERPSFFHAGAPDILESSISLCVREGFQGQLSQSQRHAHPDFSGKNVVTRSKLNVSGFGWRVQNLQPLNFLTFATARGVLRTNLRDLQGNFGLQLGTTVGGSVGCFTMDFVCRCVLVCPWSCVGLRLAWTCSIAVRMHRNVLGSGGDDVSLAHGSVRPHLRWVRSLMHRSTTVRLLSRPIHLGICCFLCASLPRVSARFASVVSYGVEDASSALAP